MQRRTVAALVVALALPTAFAAYVYAGIGNGGLTLPAEESGAAALRSTADAAAAGWSGNATLVRVAATEGAPVDGRVDPPFAFDTSADPAVPNGRALVWTFAYADAEKPGRSFFASVGGDGALLYARELAVPWCCAHPVTVAYAPDGSYHEVAAYPAPMAVDFAVDSAEAYAKVADRPEFLAFPVDHPVHQVQHELVPYEEGRAAWHVMLRTATYYALSAAIDARSGDVLHVSQWPDPSPPLPPTPCDGCCYECPGPTPEPQDVTMEYDGRLTAYHPWFEGGLPFVSRAHARSLDVVFEIEDPLPHETYVLTVYDRDWRAVERVEGTDVLEARITEFPVDGPYAFRVEAAHMLPLREVPLRGVVVLDNEAAVPVGPATRLRAEGTTDFGGEAYVPLWADGYVERAVVTLTWTRTLPTDALEVAVFDELGNEVAFARADPVDGASEIVLEAPLEGWGGDVRVRNAHGVGARVPFTLDVELVYGEPPYGGWHHGHL